MRFGLIALAALSVGGAAAGGCGRDSGEVASHAAGAAGTGYPARASAALSHRDRPGADFADDELRKPADVLAFIGVEPGMRIFEMEAGTGYYTELFSRLVGAEGEIVMHSPPAFDAFLGDAANRRVDGRLDNVRISKTSFDSLDAADGSIDLVTWMLGPHELYYRPNGGDPLGDVATTYNEIARILKPGGVFIVLDHAAAVGAPETTGGIIHRIDPAIVRALAAVAGFVFAGESDVLRNPQDSFETNVFDPSVRRKTDRFLYKFVKPAE